MLGTCTPSRKLENPPKLADKLSRTRHSCIKTNGYDAYLSFKKQQKYVTMRVTKY